MMRTVCIGYDSREDDAYQVAHRGVRRYCSGEVMPIKLDEMRQKGLYHRPTELRDGKQMWDVISGAPMSTEFAISRFLAVELVKRMTSLRRKGWVLFMDCDVLIRKDINPLFELVEPHSETKALFCVQHQHIPTATVKMDGQMQLGEVDARAQGRYQRKNWSSVMLLNVDHPSNNWLNARNINSPSVPGRDLHRFCWLADHEIGELDPRWNWLVNYTLTDKDPKHKGIAPAGTPNRGVSAEPCIVHFTEGGPWFKGYESQHYADEWRVQNELIKASNVGLVSA